MSLLRDNERDRLRRLLDTLERDLASAPDRRVSPGKRQRAATGRRPLDQPRRPADRVPAAGKRAMTASLEADFTRAAAQPDWGAVIAGSPLGPGAVSRPARATPAPDQEQEASDRGNARPGRRRRPRRQGDEQRDAGNQSQRDELDAVAATGEQAAADGRRAADMLARFGGPMAQAADQLRSISGQLSATLSGELDTLRASLDSAPVEESATSESPQTEPAAVRAEVEAVQREGADAASAAATDAETAAQLDATIADAEATAASAEGDAAQAEAGAEQSAEQADATGEAAADETAQAGEAQGDEAQAEGEGAAGNQQQAAEQQAGQQQGDPAAAGPPAGPAGPAAEQPQQAQQEQDEASPADGEVRITSISKADAEAAMATDAAGQAGAQGAAAAGEVASEGGVSRGAGSSGSQPRLERPAFQAPQMPAWQPATDPSARAAAMGDELAAAASQPVEINPPPVRSAPPSLDAGANLQQEPVRVEVHSNTQLPQMGDVEGGGGASAPLTPSAPPPPPDPARIAGNGPAARAAAAVVAGGAIAQAVDGVSSEFQGEIESNASAAATEQVAGVGGGFQPTGSAEAAGGARIAASSTAAAGARGPDPVLPAAEHPAVPAAPAIGGGGGGGAAPVGQAPAVDTSIPAAQLPSANQPAMPAAAGGPGAAQTGGDIGAAPEVPAVSDYSSEENIPDASSLAPPANVSMANNSSAAQSSIDAEAATGDEVAPEAEAQISGEVAPLTAEMQSTYSAESGPPRSAAMGAHSGEASAAAADGEAALSGEQSNVTAQAAAHDQQIAAQHAGAAALPEPGTLAASRGLTYGDHAQSQMAGVGAPVSQPMAVPAGARAMGQSGQALAGDAAARQPNLARMGEVDRRPEFPELDASAAESTRGQIDRTLASGRQAMANLPARPLQMSGPAAGGVSSAPASGGGAAGAGAMAAAGGSAGATRAGGGAAGPGSAGPNPAQQEAARQAAIGRVEAGVARDVSAQGPATMEASAAPRVAEAQQLLDSRQQVLGQHVGDAQSRAQDQWNSTTNAPPAVTSADASRAAEQAWSPHQAEAHRALATMNSDIAAAETQAEGQHQAAIGERNTAAAAAHVGMTAAIAGVNAGFTAAQASAESGYQTERQTAQGEFEAAGQQAQAAAQQGYQQAQQEADAGYQQAQQQMESDAQAAEQSAVSEQEAARTQADADRQQLQSDMDSQVQSEIGRMNSEVDAAAQQGQAEIDGHLAQGEANAAREIEAGIAQAEAEEQAARAEVEANEAELEQKRQQEAEERNNRSGVGKVTGWVKDRASDALNAIKGAIDALVNAIKSIISAVCDAIVSVLRAARDLAMAALDAARDLALAALEAVKNLIQGLISAIASALRAFISLVADAIRAVVSALADALSFIIEALETVLNTIIEAAQFAFNAVLDGFIGLVSLVDEDLGQALDDATQGFQDRVNSAADGLQENISAASDAAQEGVQDAADTVNAGITAAEENAIAAVNTVEEGLHTAVEVAYEAGVAVTNAAFDAAEFAVEAATDIAIAAVELGAQVALTGLSLTQAAMHGDMDMAMEALNDLGDAVSNVGAAIVENIPGPIKEAFIDFWNSQWRDMIIGGLIAVGAGILIATGVGAIAVIAIGAAVGAATYGGGELLAQEATQDLHEETGAIYVAGQGYIQPQVGDDGVIRFTNEEGEVIGGYMDAEGNPVPPGTPGAQLVVPEGVDPANYEWAIRNFNIDESGDVSDRAGHELMGYVGSEALEGAIQGGMSAASAVGGAKAGAFLASRFGGAGANVLLRGGAGAVDDVARIGVQGADDVARMGAQSAFRTRVLGGVGEAGVDMATSSVQQGAVQMVETYERTGDLGQAWDVGYRSAQQGLTSPTALITSMVMVGGTSAQARFLDDLGFMQNPGVRQAVDTALETGYETGGGVVGEGANAFYTALRDGQSVEQALAAAQTAAGSQLAPEQLLFNLTMNGLGNYGGSFAERRYQEGAINPDNGYPSGRPEGGDGGDGGDGTTTRQTEGGDVTELGDLSSRPGDQRDAPPAGGSTTRPGDGGDVTVLGGGTTTRPDGSTVRPDGTVTRPDGTVIRPDGTTTRPGEGGDVTEIGTSRPRDQGDDTPPQQDQPQAPDGTVPDPSLRADEFDPTTLRDPDATPITIADSSKVGAYANLATSRDGLALLSMPEGRALLGTNEGRALLDTPGGRDLLMSPEGRALLRSPEGQAMLLSPAGQQFLISGRGQQLMNTPGGRELLFTADGQAMLATPETRALLNDPTAVRLMTFEGGPALAQSETGQTLLNAPNGQDLINNPAFADLMALPEGRAMLDDPAQVGFLMGRGSELLNSPRGRVLLTTSEGQAQFRSPEGQRLFNSPEGRIRLDELGGVRVLDDPNMYQLLMTPEGQQVVFSPEFNSFVDSRRSTNGLILSTQDHVLVDRPIGTEPGVDPIQHGRELLGRLRDGDRTALAELGVDLPPDFDVASVEWGLARMSDGSVHLMRGDSGSVAPNRVAGAQDLVSHSHPLVADRTIETPRPIGDILADPSQNYLLFPSGSTGDIGYIYRSFQLEGFAGGPRVTEHTIHLPYQFLGRDPSGQPIIGQGDGVQPGPSARPNDSAPSIEAVITETPRIVGYMPEPQGEGQPPVLHPIYATNVTYRAGDEVLHSGEFYTYSAPSAPGGHYSSFSDLMPGATDTSNASVDRAFAELGYGPMAGSYDGLDVFRTPNTPVGRTHRDRSVVEAAAQKLARGDRSGFTDLGMTSEFNPPSSHWMIGQWPDGSYGVIRGDQNGIPLQNMPDGVTPVAAIRAGDGSVFDLPPQQAQTQPQPGPGPEGVTGRGDGENQSTGAVHPPGSTQHILHPDGTTEVRPLTNPDGSPVRSDTPADLTPILSGMDGDTRTRAETVLSTMEPQARSDFEVLARLQQDGRIRGLEGWIEFVSRTDQSPDYLTNVSHELSIARQLAENGPPGRVVDLGADGEGVFDPLTAQRLPTYDIRVQDPGGPVREIEVKSVVDPETGTPTQVTEVSQISGAVGNALTKLKRRDAAGMPIGNPELVVRMQMGESRVERAGNAVDVVQPDGRRYRQLADGRIIEKTNLFDQVPDHLANIETGGQGKRGQVSQDGPALQRVVLQSMDGTTLATFERTADAWVRVDQQPVVEGPSADSHGPRSDSPLPEHGPRATDPGTTRPASPTETDTQLPRTDADGGVPGAAAGDRVSGTSAEPDATTPIAPTAAIEQSPDSSEGPPPAQHELTAEVRTEWTQRLAEDPASFDSAPAALRSDREYMLAAMEGGHGNRIAQADPSLLDDASFRLEALRRDSSAVNGLYSAYPDLFTDPAVVLQMAEVSYQVSYVLWANGSPLANNVDFSIELVRRDPLQMLNMSEAMRANDQVIAAALEASSGRPNFLTRVDQSSLLRDPALSVLQRQIESRQFEMNYLPEGAFTDPRILPSVLAANSRHVTRADVIDALRADPALARDVVEKNPMVYGELPRDVRRRLRREAPDTVQRAQEFQSQLDDLGMAGISERASSIDNVRELIRNRTESGDDDPRPLAIVMYPTVDSDHNGAFRHTEVENLMRHYRVVYVEPGSNRNIIPELQGITGLANRQAEVLVVAGHGMRTSTQIAGNPWLLGGLWPGQNINTGNEGMLQRGGFGDFIAADGHIVLESCSTGKGGAEKNNMANMFSRLAPHANVHAPTVDGNNTFQYGPNGEFIRPDYYGIERRGWPWNRRTEINRDPSVYYHVDAQHGAAMQPEGSAALHDAAQPDGATQPLGFDELASDSDAGGQPRSASPWSGLFGSTAGPQSDQPTLGDDSAMGPRADGPMQDPAALSPEGTETQLDLPPGDAQGDSTMQRSPVLDMDPAPIGMGGVNRIFLARDANGNEFVVKARKQSNFPYSAVDEEIEGIRMMEALGGPRYLGEVRFFEDGIWIEGIAMEKVNGVDLARAQTEGGRPDFDISTAHHSDLDRVFDWYVENGVLPIDWQAGNFMATAEGLVPIDAPIMMPASQGEINEARRTMHAVLDRIQSGQGQAADATGSDDWFTGSPVPGGVLDSGEEQ